MKLGTSSLKVEREDAFRWRIPRQGPMRVPGRIYASEKLMAEILSDHAIVQVANVACLPGIVGFSMAMPDIHWGYGFPIGGVAAFDPDEGVVSPGGVGYDINCGVRLVATDLDADDIQDDMRRLVGALHREIPSGIGRGGIVRLTERDLRKVCLDGARWAVKKGFGHKAELDHIEERGCLVDADPDAVSQRAKDRGIRQLGSLGSGNHFLELQRVAEVHLPEIAARLGLREGAVTVSIHSGSRGFGHQVCTDYLRAIAIDPECAALKLPDRQLAAAPLRSEMGQRYLAAMASAVNFGFANRQVMSHTARLVIERTLRVSPKDLGWHLIYEVAHNIAKMERHQVGGEERVVCVHRKGATRAFGPNHPSLPEGYRDIGQPVLIPGDMGRASYVLVGTERAMSETWGSSCHGAGRVLSRTKARKLAKGRDLVAELAERGVTIAATGDRTIAEEMPEAYKDVTEVVEVVAGAGLSRIVARLQPIGVIKG